MIPPSARNIATASLILASLALTAAAPTEQIDLAFAPWTGSKVPGCAIGIQRKGEEPVYRAYGMANLEQPASISVDTIFESGSVAKQVTAAIVLQLVERGVLRLDDDVGRYLPELPDYGATITLDHLLTHTSGLRDWSDLADFTGWPRYTRVYSNADALAMLSRQRGLNHAPGARFSYTNSGYNLLAIIVERATGQRFSEHTREHLFKPLGMANTSWRDDHLRLVPGRATGYRRAEDGRLVDGSPMEDAVGSGGMMTNVRDLLRWVKSLDDGALGAFVTRKLAEPVRLSDGSDIGYGRGLMLSNYRGDREIFHNGGTNGYQAWAGRYIEAGVAIALMCNGRTVGPDTQARKVAQLFFPPPPETAVTPQPPEELQVRAGLYVSDERYELLDIRADRGNLRTVGGFSLRFVSPGRFRLGESDLIFRGNTVERRRPDGTRVTLNRRERASHAISERDWPVGAYASDEMGSKLTLRRVGNSLELRFADRPAAMIALTPLFKDAYRGDGLMMQVLRESNGAIAFLRFRTERVYALDFRPVLPPEAHRSAGASARQNKGGLRPVPAQASRSWP